MPGRNEPEISAPNTATASAPPVCRLALNRPPASPARAAGQQWSDYLAELAEWDDSAGDGLLFTPGGGMAPRHP
jgi:hypothetical protein